MSSEKVDGWIKCSERLPERNERVLVYSYVWGVTGARISGDINYGELWINDSGGSDLIRNKDFHPTGVTHWMPLPEAPLVDENKKTGEV